MKPRLSPEVFDDIIAGTRLHSSGRSARGAKLVLVEGCPVQRAAQTVGASKQAVSQAVQRIVREAASRYVCPCCGRET